MEHILHTNKNFREKFEQQPITAFKRNKKLKKNICSNRIKNGKVKSSRYFYKRKMFSVLWKHIDLSPKIIRVIINIEDPTNSNIYKIFLNGNFKSKYVIYLMEYTLSKKINI